MLGFKFAVFSSDLTGQCYQPEILYYHSRLFPDFEEICRCGSQLAELLSCQSIWTASAVEDFHVEVFQRAADGGKSSDADTGTDQHLYQHSGIRLVW